MNNPEVVLVAPPIDLIGMPSLAVGLLKACLIKRNITCKAIYTNRIFLDLMGDAFYQDFIKDVLSCLIIECLFAPLAHEGFAVVKAEDLNREEMPEKLREYHRIVGPERSDLSDQMLQESQTRCRRFVKTISDKIISLHPKILGFSNSFMSTNAAIAIGHEVKRTLPDVIYVVGGTNCQGIMGEEISRTVSIIDYVFQGDSDHTFPDFCERYLCDKYLPPAKLIKCSPTRDPGSLPVPDYSDFFEQPGLDPQSVILSFESSRGCWWGEKHRCKFCGESEGDLSYRFKSPERIIDELFSLRATYPDVKTFFATDAIFPESYFKDVLPCLIKGNFNRKLNYETKAHISPEQIAVMKKCGLDRILVGIESLSTRLLKILDKGTSALNNIRLLRNCLEGGVQVIWLFMMGIPGDSAEDYEEQLLLLPWLEHLMPPKINPMRIQRFSPFFEAHESNGITRIQALAAYKYAFPETMDLERLAYFFTAEYRSEARINPGLMSRLIHRLTVWQERWWRSSPAPELSVHQADTDRWEVRDTRTCAEAESQMLDAEEYMLLKKCRKGIPIDLLPSDSSADRLLKNGYLVKVDGRLLSVVCEISSHKNKVPTFIAGFSDFPELRHLSIG